ncbi:MAG: tyrosine-type recombinase/integrase, partial [Clostridium sp.]
FPISTSAKKAINEYLNTRNYEASEPLFLSQKNSNGSKAIKRQRAYKVINDAAKAAGIKEKIGTHTLRKTFSYHAYKSGISIELIQKLFNHSAPSITLRYIGITQDTLDTVYLNLNL